MANIFILVGLLLTTSTWAINREDPISMLRIPNLSMSTEMSIKSNYISKGQSLSDDKAGVNGKYNLHYGNNVKFSISASSIKIAAAPNAPVELKYNAEIFSDFGIPWHKASAQYTATRYPNFTNGKKNELGLKYKIKYLFLSPYAKLTTMLDGNRLRYVEGGIKFYHNGVCGGIHYAKHDSKDNTVPAQQVRNGKNLEASIGYKWKKYTLAIHTNKFHYDKFTTGTNLSDQKKSWFVFSYNSN